MATDRFICSLAAAAGLVVVAAAFTAGSPPVAAEGERYVTAEKRKTIPANRAWLLKRKSLKRRLRRQDAELRRSIAQLDRIARKWHRAGRQARRSAPLRARLKWLHAWRKSQARLSAKLSRIYRTPGRLSQAQLEAAIKEVESMQEAVRNKRQMASTAFQNFDQKSNQMYNLLSSIMKAMNEMRMGTVRNML